MSLSCKIFHTIKVYEDADDPERKIIIECLTCGNEWEEYNH